MDIKDFYIIFDELKEGDVLYDIALQRNMIIKHLFKNDKYAIITDNLYEITYMKDGRRYNSDIHPRLLKKNPFQQEKEEVKEEEEKPKEDNNRNNMYL